MCSRDPEGVVIGTLDLTNQGTVTVNHPLTMEKASAVHANSGTIQVNENVTVSQSGTSPSFTNSGTISVAGGKTFQVNNGGFTHSSGEHGMGPGPWRCST